MSRQIHIFATKADLIPNLTLMESRKRVKYVRKDFYYSSNIPIYESLLEYRKLGINTTGDHNSDDTFFVLDRDVVPYFEKTSLFLVFSRYSMNQLTNPGSIVFRPGGIYRDKYLICGHIGTISNSEISMSLFKDFSRTITSGFEKVNSYRVGKNALDLLRNGMRLITMGVDEPEEYDLSM